MPQPGRSRFLAPLPAPFSLTFWAKGSGEGCGQQSMCVRFCCGEVVLVERRSFSAPSAAPRRRASGAPRAAITTPQQHGGRRAHVGPEHARSSSSSSAGSRLPRVMMMPPGVIMGTLTERFTCASIAIRPVDLPQTGRAGSTTTEHSANDRSRVASGLARRAGRVLRAFLHAQFRRPRLCARVHPDAARVHPVCDQRCVECHRQQEGGEPPHGRRRVAGGGGRPCSRSSSARPAPAARTLPQLAGFWASAPWIGYLTMTLAVAAAALAFHAAGEARAGGAARPCRTRTRR